MGSPSLSSVLNELCVDGSRHLAKPANTNTRVLGCSVGNKYRAFCFSSANTRGWFCRCPLAAAARTACPSSAPVKPCTPTFFPGRGFGVDEEGARERGRRKEPDEDGREEEDGTRPV
eukprot:g1011.t1